MNHLDKPQLKFLRYLSKNGVITDENIKESQEEIISFLKEQKFIYVEREILHIRFNQLQNTYHKDLGKILSVSISPQGKAYLESLKIYRREKWIPIFISLLALLKSYGITDKAISLCKQLLELLQKLQ